MAQAPPLLTTDPTNELQDGEALDFAGEGDVGLAPQSNRVWIAQGRVRAALQASSGQRMHAEDVSFPKLGSPCPVGVPCNQKVIAVEFDDVHSRLYTLTEQAVYVENISLGVSSNRISFAFSSAPITMSAPVDIRLWPADNRIFILTGTQIVTLHDNTTSITYDGAAMELANSPSGFLTDSTNTITPLKVYLFERFKVAQDVNGHVMAYVLARSLGYHQTRLLTMLLVCDLSAPGYSTPTFDADPSIGGTRFVFWNPVPASCPMTAPGCNGSAWFEYSIYDVEIASTANALTAVLACGQVNQVRRIDVTKAFLNTVASNGLLQPIPNDGVRVDLSRGVLRLQLMPNDPTRFLACTNANQHQVNMVTGTNVSLPTVEQFALAQEGQHDVFFMQYLTDHPLLWWTLGASTVDHAVRAVDWTGSPQLLFEKFQMHKCDGGVALPQSNAIYLPTISGVARYGRNAANTAWEAKDSTFQPNESAPGVGDASITEHIAIGENFPGGTKRLVTASGRGAFDEWVLDSSDNPMPVHRHWGPTDPVTHGVNYSWYGIPSWTGGGIYANDIAFVTLRDQSGILRNYILTDVAHFNLNEGALIAWKWNPALGASGDWEKVAIVSYWGEYTPAQGDPLFLTNTIHVDQTNGIPYAFVSDTGGFTIIDLRGLLNEFAPVPSAPSMLVTHRESTNMTTQTHGLKFAVCTGMAASKNKVFATFYNGLLPGGPSGQATMFDWNPTTLGQVTGVATSITSFQVASGPNPVPAWGQAFRCRYLTLNASSGCGLLYVCAKGYLLEFGYSGTSTNNFTYRSNWKSDYDAPIQDARPYVFSSGTKILVSKDSETFAIVNPSTTTCP